MKKLFLKLYEINKRGEYSWIPSSLAFYLFISFIPLLFALFLIVIKYTNVDISQFDGAFDITAFQSIIDNLVQYIKGGVGSTSIIVLVIIFIYSIYVASNGIGAIMYAINSFFGFEKINIIRRKLLSFFVTFIILLSILLMIIFISVIPTVFIIFKIDTSYLITLFIIIPTLYCIIHIIYYIVGDFKLKAKQIYKGALFTTLSITLILIFSSLLFSGETLSIIYGSLAAIILLGHFFLYIGYCFYIGIAINVASYELENTNIK